MPVNQASRVGTIDPKDKNRVYVDEELNEVAAGSSSAAFIYNRADLQRVRDRRAELFKTTGDEAERVHRASTERALAAARTRQAAAEAEVAQLEAAVKANNPKSSKAAAADEDEDTASTSKTAAKAEATAGAKA